MNRTRFSLFYLATYLIVGGVALLLAPDWALKLLRSSGSYGEMFPRVVGMALSGFGLSIASIIRARAQMLYAGTLVVRSYFIVCLLWFYRSSQDPFFLVVLAVVAVGFALTLTCYWIDRTAPSKA
ncbi:MAG: hypothetical protein JO133_06945 [Burkholderiaceae bacterium]|nr:hypothetical protein [Burkholderiaceae bacterium]